MIKDEGQIFSNKESALCLFDTDLQRQHGNIRIIGTDEAGRGPLCGPVVACAAYIPTAAYSLIGGLVNDSKKLSPHKREKAFSFMLECGVKFGFAFASAREIDSTDILSCSLRSMLAAVRKLEAQLPHTPDVGRTLVLVDGNRRIRDNGELWQQTVVGGDAKSASIAAASIFAKVIRDRWLMLLDRQYPQYGFAKHKGYGTKAHIAAIEQYGPCPEHRFTFAPIKGRFTIRETQKK